MKKKPKRCVVCKGKGCGGFTIMELIMAIIVAAVIMAALNPLFRSSMMLFVKTADVAQDNQAGRIAFNRMVRDIKMISSINSGGAGTLSFDDLDGNTVVYGVSGSTLTRNGFTAMNNVARLQFTYYDINGVELASPATTDLWVVRIELGIEINDAESVFSAEISPRNLHVY